MHARMTRYDDALLSIFEHLKMADWEASMLETYAGRDGCMDDLEVISEAQEMTDKIAGRLRTALRAVMKNDKNADSNQTEKRVVLSNNS